MKKNIIFVVGLLVTFMGFIACSDDKEDEQTGKITGGKTNVMFAVDQEKLEFEVEESELRLKITSLVEWECEKEGDWFEVVRYEGDKIMGVIASTNNSVEKREGKLTFKAKGMNDVVLPVMQAAAAEATLTLSRINIVLPKKENKETVTIETNQASVKIEESTMPADWSVTLAKNNKSMEIVVPENTTGTDIVGKFTVVAGVESNTKKIEVTLKQIATEPVTLNATGYRVRVADMGGLSGTAKDDWCTVTKDGEDLLVAATANIGGEDRETEITFGDGSSLLVLQTSETYNTGDVFKYNGKPVGMVIKYENGELVVLSLKDKKVVWSTEYVQLGTSGAGVATDYYPIVKKIEGWQKKYPAFAFCEELDKETGMEGWALCTGVRDATSGCWLIFQGMDYKIVIEGLKKIEGASEFIAGAYWTATENSQELALLWNFSGDVPAAWPIGRDKAREGISRPFWKYKITQNF